MLDRFGELWKCLGSKQRLDMCPQHVTMHRQQTGILANKSRRSCLSAYHIWKAITETSEHRIFSPDVLFLRGCHTTTHLSPQKLDQQPREGGLLVLGSFERTYTLERS